MCGKYVTLNFDCRLVRGVEKKTSCGQKIVLLCEGPDQLLNIAKCLLFEYYSGSVRYGIA